MLAMKSRQVVHLEGRGVMGVRPFWVARRGQHGTFATSACSVLLNPLKLFNLSDRRCRAPPAHGPFASLDGMNGFDHADGRK